MNIYETLEYVNNRELNLEGEIWKVHPRFPNRFGSNLGRVKKVYDSGKEIIMQQFIFNNRIKVVIRDKGVRENFQTSRFILECFVGEARELDSNHKNSIPYDNRIENLEWCTKKENMSNPATRSKMKLSAFSKKRNKVNEDYIIDGEIWKLNNRLNVEVSSFGRIRKQKKNGYFYYTQNNFDVNGYKVCGIGYIHRIVAETFLENPDPQHKTQVDHINTIKTDNRAENLSWVTPLENMLNENTLVKQERPVLMYSETGVFINRFRSLSEAKKYGYSNQGIRRSCVSGNKLYKGYKWEYEK